MKVGVAGGICKRWSWKQTMPPAAAQRGIRFPGASAMLRCTENRIPAAWAFRNVRINQTNISTVLMARRFSGVSIEVLSRIVSSRQSMKHLAAALNGSPARVMIPTVESSSCSRTGIAQSDSRGAQSSTSGQGKTLIMSVLCRSATATVNECRKWMLRGAGKPCRENMLDGARPSVSGSRATSQSRSSKSAIVRLSAQGWPPRATIARVDEKSGR